MENLKILIFLEIVAMIVTALLHLVAFLIGDDFPLILYPIIFAFMLLVFLLVFFILIPIAEWLF